MIAAAVAFAAALQAGSAAGSGNAPVTLDVTNVRSSTGHIRIALCRQNQFLSNTCAYHDDATAVRGTTRVIVPNVAPGVYAAQVFHDGNDNSEVDRGAFGRPLEGVGFSNDARIGLSGPKFARAEFRHADEPQVMRITLKHFTTRDRQAAAR